MISVPWLRSPSVGLPGPRKNRWLVFLACFLVVLSSPAGFAPAGSEACAQQPALEITLLAPQTSFLAGEPLPLRWRLQNRGEHTVTVLCPPTPEGLLSGSSPLSLFLISSEGAVRSAEAAASLTGKAVPVSLPPGSWRETVLDLSRLFGPLPPDRYTAFLRYDLTGPQIHQPGEDRPAPPPAGPLWTGRLESNPVTFLVQAQDQKKLIQKYASQWRQDTDPLKKLRALWWLKDNVLKEGMSQAQVKSLLGEPTVITEPAGDQEWLYKVNKTGLKILFRAGAMKNLSPFET
jgi:hypothetical protein